MARRASYKLPEGLELRITKIEYRKRSKLVLVSIRFSFGDGPEFEYVVVNREGWRKKKEREGKGYRGGCRDFLTDASEFNKTGEVARLYSQKSITKAYFELCEMDEYGGKVKQKILEALRFQEAYGEKRLKIIEEMNKKTDDLYIPYEV